MLAQDLGDVNGRGLQKNILISARSSASAGRFAAATLDPENSIAVGGFQEKRKLHAQLLRAPAEVEDLFGLVGNQLQLGIQALESF